MTKSSLTRFAWWSISAAIVTIILKTAAYFLTGSIGLLSDALESFVNLAAAIMALFILRVAEKPPDEDHMYGHTKAEYFSSVIEAVLIIIAACSIGYTAIPRLFHPQAIEQPIIGLILSISASFINLFVALRLLKAGKQYHSITLTADAHHLLTDVWTSAGVLLGIALVLITGLPVLDPIIALLVACNIIFTGTRLIKESVMGFMDTAISTEEVKKVKNILDMYAKTDIQYHAVRTRQSGARRFVSAHILVPGKWSVQKGHTLLEKIEKDIRVAIPNTTVFTHLEPLEDSSSWADTSIDRN